MKLRWFRLRFGLVATRPRRAWQVLLHRRASAELVGWMRRRRVSFREAWTTCPRGDWSLELAAHLGVDRSLLCVALEDCQEYLVQHDILIERASREMLRSKTRGWLDHRVATTEWCTSVKRWMSGAADQLPEVRSSRGRVEASHAWGSVSEMHEASLDYDRAYFSAHQRFASIVRRRISADVIEATVLGSAGHPYRSVMR